MFVAAPIEHTYLLHMNIRYASALGALFSIAIVSLSACNVPAAMGEASSLIVIVPGYALETGRRTHSYHFRTHNLHHSK